MISSTFSFLVMSYDQWCLLCDKILYLILWCIHLHLLGLPRWLSSKECVCQYKRHGLIPGLGRSPGERNGNPLQYSCLGNPMDREAWWATVHGVAKSQTWFSAELSNNSLNLLVFSAALEVVWQVNFLFQSSFFMNSNWKRDQYLLNVYQCLSCGLCVYACI